MELGDRDQSPGGRQLLAELPDQVSKVGLELRIVAKIFGMNEAEVFRNKPVAINLFTSRY